MERNGKKKCPVCGARMKDGVCVWCGEEERREDVVIDSSELTLLEPTESEMAEERIKAERRGTAEGPSSFWWEKESVCMVLLIVCFPAGIILMYAFSHFRRWQRNLITVSLIAFWTGVFLMFSSFFPLSFRYGLPEKIEVPLEIPAEEKSVISPEDDELLIRLLFDEALSRKRAVDALIEEGKSAEEAELLVDGSDADFRQNALMTAEWCASSLAMSRMAIYEQLSSPYGEGFTEEESAWALDHLEADYAHNALLKAEQYMEIGKNREETLDILTSDYGEMFSAEDAESAVTAVFGTD